MTKIELIALLVVMLFLFWILVDYFFEVIKFKKTVLK